MVDLVDDGGDPLREFAWGCCCPVKEFGVGVAKWLEILDRECSMDIAIIIRVEGSER